MTCRGIAVPPDGNADLEASVGYALEPGDVFRRAGRRRSIYSAIITGQDDKVSSYPTAPAMQSKTRRKPSRCRSPTALRILALGPGRPISA